MDITTLVTGPYPLDQRTFDVPEATFAVVLLNGKAWDVRTPGRTGGVWSMLFNRGRALPAVGNVQYLLFQASPVAVTVVENDVRLADGARVEAVADILAQPVWASNPAQLLEIVRTYGLNTTAYVAAATASLQADFRALLRAAVDGEEHATLHAGRDARDTLRPGGERGVMQVLEVLDIRFTRDAQVVALEDLERQFEIEAAQARAEADLFSLQRGLAIARAELANDIGSRQALSAADTDRLVGEMYGIPAWAVAFPDQYAAERERHQQLLSNLLTEYSDVLPLFAELFDEDPRDVLAQLATGGLTTPSTTGTSSAAQNAGMDSSQEATSQLEPKATGPRWNVEPSVQRRLDLVIPEIPVVGVAPAVIWNETRELTIVVAHAESGAREGLRNSDTTLSGGRLLDVLIVVDRPDKIAVVTDIVGYIGGVTATEIALDISDQPDKSIVRVSSVSSTRVVDDQAARLARLLNSLTVLTKDTSPTIVVEV
ncbi:hypothetical protein [Kribbella sp. NPDC000426]|uniref:hypothetical protein n=1 Tax=Kribbella sp. NPDC000426 TaxID=3154255 RepID=UPI00332EEC13